MLTTSTRFVGYAPGSSWLHGLHPHTKCLMFFMTAGTLLAAGTAAGAGLLAAGGCAAVAASSPGRSQALGLVRVLFVLAAISLLLNALFTPGHRLPGPEGLLLWPTVEGMHRGAVAALRLIALAALSFALVTTTCPRDLGEAVEGSLGRIPAFRGAGLSVDVAGRFVPGFIGDAMRVRAIRSVRVGPRGHGALGRLREAGSYVLPLMVSAVRRAERLADAMDARCYSGRRGRAAGPSRRPGRADYAALAITVAVCALALALREA